jgi:hypothetical protein
LLPKNFVDGPDEQLYEYALSLFHKEISMRNISLESCRIVEVAPEPLFEWNYLVTSNDEPATAASPLKEVVVVSPSKHTVSRIRPITAKASASKGVGVGKPPRSSTKPSSNNTNASNVQKKKRKNTNSVNTTVLDDDDDDDDEHDDNSIVLRAIEGHKPFWLHIPK